MNTLHRVLISSLLTTLSLVYTSATLADEYMQPYHQPYAPPTYQPAPYNPSYADKVGNKALNGAANIATGWLEIPKSMIKNSNGPDGNVVYGLIGGAFEGMLQTAYRTSLGVMDLLTAPIPTKPIVQPQYIWDDFEESTIYGDVFRLDENAQSLHYRAP